MDIKQKVEFIMMQLSEVLEELQDDKDVIPWQVKSQQFALTPVVSDYTNQISDRPYNPSIPALNISPIQSSEQQIAQQMKQNSQVMGGEAKISNGKWGGENVEIHDFGSTTI